MKKQKFNLANIWDNNITVKNTIDVGECLSGYLQDVTLTFTKEGLLVEGNQIIWEEILEKPIEEWPQHILKFYAKRGKGIIHDYTIDVMGYKPSADFGKRESYKKLFKNYEVKYE
jgi:hypothetical protein